MARNTPAANQGTVTRNTPPANQNNGRMDPNTPRDNYGRPSHPRERDFVDFSARPPHKFYEPHHAHYFGYRVHSLPAGYWYRDWRGVRYYCYDDVYYRYINDCYVVCRPPFGTSIAASVAADIAWTAITVSYYNTLNNTYSQINSNNAYITEQNEQIAKNNAILARQNSALASESQYMSARSTEAYTLAQALGLVQSYASADTEYYYQDGVFYRKDASGQYYVIVPPAGSIVDNLPEDYDTLTYNGVEYYQVDGTVYRIVVVGGYAKFEVLGQKY